MKTEHPFQDTNRELAAPDAAAGAARVASDSTGTVEYQPSTWDLSDLLPDSRPETIDAAIARLEATVDRFVDCRDRLSAELTQDDFLPILEIYQDIMDQMTILSGFGNLRFASNTQDSSALAYRNRINQLLTRLDNRMLFFEIWWKDLDDEAAEKLLPDPEEHWDFRHFLLEMRRFKPHTLDERSEQILNTKNANGPHALVTLYSMLTNRLDFELEVDGDKTIQTEDQMRSLFYSSDPDIRAAVCQEIFRVYERESEVLAQIYAYRVRDWVSDYVELRKFKSPISVRNLGNDISDEAIEVMLDVVHQNAPVFRRFFKIKGRLLGMDKLRRYDLYAPLTTSDKAFTYQETVDLTLDTLAGFDQRFVQLAKRVFEADHLDSEIRKGKRSGAFCSTLTPHYTPWVMVNFAGRLRDVTTLAHELGHAIHSMMAEHHSVLTQHPSLPLAETASVFSEMMINERLLAEESDTVARREILSSMLDDIYATVMRQTYFVRFEIAAFQTVLDNGSSEELFELYLRHLHEQFDDCMDITPEFRYEWISIPHMFRTPFYCYAYSFGQLLVLALYHRYRQEGDAFKPGYFRLLGHGGSKSPADALGELGIEITDPAFWQGGFDIVKGMIDELESLAAT